jgi:CRISPR-associated protein Cas6
MSTVDLAFALVGTKPIPADHGYLLYASLSRLVPAVHSENGIAVHPIRGRQIGDRLMSLEPWSRLTLRAVDSRIGELIQIAGKALNVGGQTVRVGVPSVFPLRPASALRSRLVTIKGFTEPESFQEAVRRQLDALGAEKEVIVTIGKRRTLRIRDKEIVGFEVLLEGLSAEESLKVQKMGLGGRRHMGCGIFAPPGDTGLS